MQFKDTETYKNLARAFAGEAQAGLRYQFTAQLAMQQGYKVLADTVRAIAKNETNHAKIFFDHMIKKGGSVDKVQLCADYPFHAGDLQENLRLSAMDETEEVLLYPVFAKTAKEEGHEEIANSFLLIAEIEKNHERIFSYLYNALKDNTLYKNESPILWICSECGYMHTAKDAWDVCPVCHKSQGYVELHIPFQKERIS